MKIYCTNESIDNIPEGYDEKLDITNKKDIGFNFWDNYIKLEKEFSKLAIDLLYLSIFVFVCDRTVKRNIQNDGWTRTISLNIPVSDVDFWNSQKNLVTNMLNFLSGDNWDFEFRTKTVFQEELYYSSKKYKELDKRYYDKICMFSGGLDSFIGAIDLLEEITSPILLVSHYGGGKGTKSYQNSIFGAVKNQYKLDEKDHIQSYVVAKNGKEDTTRTRSFMFFSHAIAYASASEKKTQLFIPENGYISLNVPLSGARFGSSSTRTTHPYYMSKLQDLINNMNLDIEIINPYQFKTKGEMMKDCKNSNFLKEHYVNTMSCSHPDNGRFKKEKTSKHCGDCIPCIVRKAAILSAYGKDETEYRHNGLNESEAGILNKNAFLQMLEKHNPNRAIFDIQKSGPLINNLFEFADIYNRSIEELYEIFKEVHVNEIN
ncbi:Qat anti-phage system QueC-like protein QatC [Streptococcus sp. CSL10205-OR2]|uniref:Qat anti-phage system QueC-like protein QatC n=1 Tax=Streptococcus sp. CSL10205-OR2 TaxID=2980558 RepID=UPI0021D993BF|nr:Qat anti-phage system QueC-like protein QatC [Streptococcus sp. CSL10205-OR2]MCU9533998.1 7-cyano-7-deazaguanine synthase [Streptococcus sp. CSL10205-OR2]